MPLEAAVPPILLDNRLDLDVGRVLACPRCSEDNLHHDTIAVCGREREDGNGQRAEVSHAGDVTGPVALPANSPCFVGRRGDIAIRFWCEICGSDDPVTLRIVQHKGSTLVYWERP